MLKQTRAERWLKVLETAEGLTSGTLQSMRTLRGVGRAIPEQGQTLLVSVGSDPINLIAVADPPIEGTVLAEQLKDVIQRAGELRTGRRFTEGVDALQSALRAVIPVLRAIKEDDVETVDDIIADLDRSFMLSLIMSMSAHNAIANTVGEWEKRHGEFIQGRNSRDVGHYFSTHATNYDAQGRMIGGGWDAFPEPPNFYAIDPGPGRIHMQHLISAIHSGANISVMGGGSTNTDYYPEAEAEMLSKNDVRVEFFNDIRKIRNDFVHHQGIVKNAAKLKFFDWEFKEGDSLAITMDQMIEMMDSFPREQLAVRPTPSTTKPVRKNMTTSFDVELVDAYSKYVHETPGVRFEKANDEMLTDWLVKKGVIEGTID